MSFAYESHVRSGPLDPVGRITTFSSHVKQRRMERWLSRISEPVLNMLNSRHEEAVVLYG
jgi:hypothetical protein